MADKKQDAAPSYPAPPMTEQDHFDAAKHDIDAHKKDKPKADAAPKKD